MAHCPPKEEGRDLGEAAGLWDRGVVAEVSSRIGADRSLAIRQEIEQKFHQGFRSRVLLREVEEALKTDR